MGASISTISAHRTAPAGRELVVATIAQHAGSLLATARRYSLCADDAQDAYQRGLEIFLRRADGVDPAGAPAWLRTVIKHEALAVRAGRLRLVGPLEADLDLHEARETAGADERAAAFERLERSAEALARLKPQELRALVLKAHGYTYDEICEITGWTYTKVNRCLSEGRRALRDRLADIDEGRECVRWSGSLSALADGEASADEVLAMRPHLRGCASCRATLREYRMAQRGVAAVVPLAALGGIEGPREGGPTLLMRLYEAIAGGAHERAAACAQKVQAGLEAASSGKLAAVAASATALAGSGVAVIQAPLPAHRVHREHAVAEKPELRAEAVPSTRDGAVPARDRGDRDSRPAGRGHGRSRHRAHGEPASPGRDRRPRNRRPDAPPREFSAPSADDPTPTSAVVAASDPVSLEAEAASTDPAPTSSANSGPSEFGP